MASSSLVLESTMQETVQGTSTQEAPAYEIKGRTMTLEEWDLTVQVESPVDFTSLSYHGCNIKEYYEAQDLISYFNMLNGPTYINLIRHFWVRAHAYDRKAAQLEMDEKVLIDPNLDGNSKEEMGLEPFTCTKIRSSIMGIPVFISHEVIVYVIRRDFEGSVKDGLDNSKKKGAYSDLKMEKKILLKIQNENLLPKGRGSDQPSL